MSTERTTDDYWDHIVASWKHQRKDRLWRTFADRQQSEWATKYLLQPLCGSKVARLLKTDLFDEAVSDGIVPVLSQGAHEVWGVDVSAAVVSEASTRYPTLRACTASVSELPFKDGFFQAVFSGSTLDHYESKSDIVRAIQELHRVLEKNGKLFLTLDNLQHPKVWLRNNVLKSLGMSVGWIPYQVGKTMTCRELVTTLKDSGFNVTFVTALQHCPRWWAIRKLRKLETCDPQKSLQYMQRLSGYERLERLPSRFFTGHYLAALATKS